MAPSLRSGFATSNLATTLKLLHERHTWCTKLVQIELGSKETCWPNFLMKSEAGTEGLTIKDGHWPLLVESTNDHALFNEIEETLGELRPWPSDIWQALLVALAKSNQSPLSQSKQPERTTKSPLQSPPKKIAKPKLNATNKKIHRSVPSPFFTASKSLPMCQGA